MTTPTPTLDLQDDVLNLLLTQGQYVSFRLTWTAPDNDDGTPGDPIDLTGASAHMQIKATATGVAVVDLSTGNGGIVLGGAAGTIDVRIAGSLTENLDSFGRRGGLYDLWVVSAAGAPTRIVHGSVSFADNVTEPIVVVP